MNRNDILRAVLKKATDNGFKLKDTNILVRNKHTGEVTGYETIIFDHAFARAIWPGYLDRYRPNIKFPKRPHGIESIQAADYHLQKMALAEDRISYLEANT